MPSRKGLEQALTWLKSKMAEKDSLDAINAEVCYNVIQDLQEKRKVIGALYHQANTAKNRTQEKLQELEFDRFYESAVKKLHGYSKIDMSDEEIKDIFDPEDGDRA